MFQNQITNLSFWTTLQQGKSYSLWKNWLWEPSQNYITFKLVSLDTRFIHITWNANNCVFGLNNGSLIQSAILPNKGHRQQVPRFPLQQLAIFYVPHSRVHCFSQLGNNGDTAQASVAVIIALSWWIMCSYQQIHSNCILHICTKLPHVCRIHAILQLSSLKILLYYSQSFWVAVFSTLKYHNYDLVGCDAI